VSDGPHRGAIAAACGLMLALGWNVTNTGAVAGDLAGAFGVSLAVIGLLTAALFLAHMSAQVPGGRLVDRRGARPVGIAGATLMTVGNGVALTAPSAVLALGCRLIVGAGMGIAIIAGTTFIREALGGSLAQGLYGAAGVVGPAAALLAVPLLEPALGWRAPFASAAACAVAAAVMLAAAPRLARQSRPRAATGLRELVADRELLRLGAVHTASFGLSVVAANWIVEYLERTGWSTVRAAAVGSVFVLSAAPGRLLGGWLLARRRDLTQAAVTGALVGGGLGLAVLALGPPLGVAVLAALLAGGCSGVPFAATFGAAAEVRRDAPGTAVALVNGSASLIVVVGAPLLGLAFASTAGAQAALLLVAAAWAAAAMLAAGITVVREPA
jgi:MFS family permease